MQSIKIYPLQQRAARPPAMEFLDGSRHDDRHGIPRHRILRDARASSSSKSPTGAARRRTSASSLASIGIEKGQRFHPDANMRRAARQRRAPWFGDRPRATASRRPIPARIVYPDRKWEWAFIGGSASWDSQGYVNVDRRAAFAYVAIGMSPAMVQRVVGAGSQYLWTPRDASGAHLDGGKSYRLRLPPSHSR